jgi:DNA repair exonuclease SbcCD ATPase subunit
MKGSRRYDGQLALTRREFTRYRCPCGVLLSLKVVVSVDAGKDGDLAARAANGELNEFECSSCQLKVQVQRPFGYHDASQEVLAWVLPDSERHRELEARIEVLEQLRRETESELPDYVLNFALVYGAEGLGRLLEERRGAEQEKQRQGQALDEIKQRQEQLRERESRLDERESEFARVTRELDRRSVHLTELELALTDRKSALDRRSAELEERTAKLTDLQQSIRAESQGGASLGDDTQVLSADDVLSSAPVDGSEELSPMAVSGSMQLKGEAGSVAEPPSAKEEGRR